MDFQLTDEQVLLRDTTRNLLSRSYDQATRNKVVVSAMLPDGGTGLFVVDGKAVTRHLYRTFDGRRGAQIDLDATVAEPLGDPADASLAIRSAVIRIQSALCAEAVGAMEEALRL